MKKEEKIKLDRLSIVSIIIGIAIFAIPLYLVYEPIVHGKDSFTIYHIMITIFILITTVPIGIGYIALGVVANNFSYRFRIASMLVPIILGGILFLYVNNPSLFRKNKIAKLDDLSYQVFKDFGNSGQRTTFNGGYSMLDYLHVTSKDNYGYCSYTVAYEEVSNKFETKEEEYKNYFFKSAHQLKDERIESFDTVNINGKEWIHFKSSNSDNYNDIFNGYGIYKDDRFYVVITRSYNNPVIEVCDEYFDVLLDSLEIK